MFFAYFKQLLQYANEIIINQYRIEKVNSVEKNSFLEYVVQNKIYDK